MSVNESNTIQYTVTTSRVTDGTVLYWKTTGNTTNSDIVGGNTGSVTITNNRAIFNVAIAADVTADGTKTLGISISTGSLNGPVVVSTANPITVNDTSVPPTGYNLYSWGLGNNGQLGLNSTTNRSSPTQVGAGSTWLNVASAGQYLSAAVKTDGTLWTWGYNTAGSLGINNIAYRSSPVQVGALTNWSDVVIGGYSVMAVKSDGTLWSWGQNIYGELGTNDRVYRSSPTQIGSDTDWSFVTHSGYCGIAIKNTGAFWTWGRNDYGQLGQNNTTHRSSPVQLGSGSWTTAALDSTTLAVKSDGTLWSWADNFHGQLGRNTSGNAQISSPVQVGSSTNWSKVDVGGNSCLAIKTDGTMWSWGNDYYGQLAQNDTYISRSSPVQIAGTTWSSYCGINNGTAVALKSDGTLWQWGRNHYGQLGQNDRINRSSPVQVGSGTTYTKASIGLWDVIALTSGT